MLNLPLVVTPFLIAVVFILAVAVLVWLSAQNTPNARNAAPLVAIMLVCSTGWGGYVVLPAFLQWLSK